MKIKESHGYNYSNSLIFISLFKNNIKKIKKIGVNQHKRIIKNENKKRVKKKAMRI